MKADSSVCIVPGSFDPITYGHIDLVRRAMADYSVVYLAIMINPAKEYLFHLEERKAIAEAALSDYPSVRVITSEGMLWKLAQDLHANAIVKGYRNQTDYQYEQEMAAFNSAHYPPAKTVLLPASDALESFSSTLVRDRLTRGESIEEFMPKKALLTLERILNARRS